MPEIKDKCVPKLRFPEFKNDGEWERYPLEELFEIRNGYTPSKSNPDFWEGGTIPWFRMEDIRLNGHILSDSIQHITPFAVKGTGLFPAYSIIVATTATIGEHALIITDSLANQRFAFLTKRKSHNDKIDMLFFHQYMFIIDNWCKRNTNSGGLLSVNMPAFRRLIIPLTSLKEQQVIASCLSSLDACISASKAKLEQLKALKKGLMQKLFPAPGKTLPEYRFPEFNNDGEWVERCLGDSFEERVEKNREDLPLLSLGERGLVLQCNTFRKDISNSDKSKYLRVAKGDVAYNTMRMWQGRCVYADIEGVVSPAYTVCKPKSGIDGLFHFYLFKTQRMMQLFHQNSQGLVNDTLNLKFEVLSGIKYALPPTSSEQHMISECLASLDSLIVLEEKVEQFLETHKKGLIQQLFPH